MEAHRAASAAPHPTRDGRTIWRVDGARRAGRQPLLVAGKPRKKPGRGRNDDRPTLDGLSGLARAGPPRTAWPRERLGPRSTATT